jgi:superfamily II DNA or RNA helicase
MQETILVQKIDHANLIVQTSLGILSELGDHFSFFVPGYKFMPAYRNKVWDGKIRLFNSRSGELPAGLFHKLSEFARDRSYLIKQVESDYGYPTKINNISRDDLSKFIDIIKLPFPVRDYQFESVLHGINHERGILLSPTGSGKSLIIYTLIRWFLATNKTKALIIVPTTSLVEQMYTDFRDYGYDVDSNVHKIYSGKEKITDDKVIISTWQSIYKLPKKWFDQFGAVFGDECHGFKSKSLTSIMNKAAEAHFRFGTTGTLDGTLTHKLVLEGLFGPIYTVTTTRKLQDNETLADLNIRILLLEYSERTRENQKETTYQQEIDFIVRHEKRNKFIRNLALNQTGNTLVLFQYVEKHGKILYTMIRDKAEGNRKIFYVSGQTDTGDREAIRHIVESQKDAIIVASLGTFSTGINIKNIHNIIFASPSKSQIKVLQSIGRGLRKSDDGSTTQLFDIADDLHWKSRKNFTLLHSGERIKIYSKEQFKFEIIKVDIEDSWPR